MSTSNPMGLGVFVIFLNLIATSVGESICRPRPRPRPRPRVRLELGLVFRLGSLEVPTLLPLIVCREVTAKERVIGIAVGIILGTGWFTSSAEETQMVAGENLFSMLGLG